MIIFPEMKIQKVIFENAKKLQQVNKKKKKTQFDPWGIHLVTG